MASREDKNAYFLVVQHVCSLGQHQIYTRRILELYKAKPSRAASGRVLHYHAIRNFAKLLEVRLHPLSCCVPADATNEQLSIRKQTPSKHQVRLREKHGVNSPGFDCTATVHHT